MKIKKGMRVRYTGPLAPGVTPYPPATVVTIRRSKPVVTVQFDDGLYADWRIEDVERV